ncbi:MAG: hypothetical protein WHV26_03540 [Spirochaetota bacterium]|jgi:transposase
MYSDIIKSEAFVLYCQGLSYRKIAEILQANPGCETITHTTIKKWAETPDISGHTWIDRRNKVTSHLQKLEEASVVRQHKDVILRTEEIKDKILSELESNNLQFKTKAEAVYAFLAIEKWQKHIKDEHKRVTIEDQVSMLFDAMQEIPEVAQAIQKHWEDIYARFQAKAKKMLKDKNGS